MTCLSLTELSASNAEEARKEHLATCLRCRSIASRLAGQYEHRVDGDERQAEPVKHRAVRPTPGGVWTVWAPRSDEYLVGAVLGADEIELLLVPLLADTNWAADADIALDKDVLGYQALAPIWAGDYVLLEQAVEPVGMLSEEDLAVLTRAYDAFFAGEPVPHPAGPPVLGEADPRLGAHAARADDLHPFYEPWAHLQVAGELGPVVKARREQLGIDVDPWHDRLDVDLKDWLAFEQAQADPSTTVPVKALTRALADLALLPSKKAVDLAGASVRQHHEVDALPARGIAKARRRRGARQRPQRDEEAAEAAAKSYMARLAEELGL